MMYPIAFILEERVIYKHSFTARFLPFIPSAFNLWIMSNNNMYLIFVCHVTILQRFYLDFPNILYYIILATNLDLYDQPLRVCILI